MVMEPRGHRLEGRTDMTVNLRPYRGQKGTWEVDIRMDLADGSIHRERRKAPEVTKTQALRWGLDRERAILVASAMSLRAQSDPPPERRRERKSTPKKKVPTVEEFSPRYIEGYCEANRQKPSTIDAKRGLLKGYLLPRFGKRRLDEVSAEDIQQLKSALRDKNPKTVNNVLSVLNTMLRCAAEWGVIEEEPVRARWLKTSHSPVDFFDFDHYESLVAAAAQLDPRYLIVVLLGGDAGLRRGEMLGLEWDDLDFARGLITVTRSNWKGHVTSTKGGRIRTIPMTRRLRDALWGCRPDEGGDRVLYGERGGSATAKNIAVWLIRAQRHAGLKTRKGAHTLRHTFCSHLAMRGAPPRAIQELAGHRNITTTERYMHLSPAALDGAIRLLERGREGP